MAIFDLFDSGEKKKRLSHIKNLLFLAGQDGEVTKDEVDLILSIAVENGLSPEEFKRILERPGSISFHPPTTYKERIEQLIDLVKVMMVDGEIDANELLFCKAIADKMGFDHKIIDKIVHDIVEAVVKGVARDIAIAHLLRTVG